MAAQDPLYCYLVDDDTPVLTHSGRLVRPIPVYNAESDAPFSGPRGPVTPITVSVSDDNEPVPNSVGNPVDPIPVYLVDDGYPVNGAWPIAIWPAQGGYPVPDPVYMPTVGTASAVWYGQRRVIAAYTGPLIRVQRASDNAQTDVAQDADGLPDFAAVIAWAGGSETRIATWYDQTGQSRHATQTTWAEMPLFDAAGLYGAATGFGPFKNTVCDGRWTGSRYPKRLAVPASVTANYRNHSIFMVFDPRAAGEPSLYYETIKSAAGALGLVNTISSGGVRCSGNPNNSNSGRYPRSQMQALGSSSSTANYTFFQDGQTLPRVAKWNDTFAGAVIGDNVAATGNFLSYENFLAWGCYPAALSDADSASIVTALNATFGIEATGASAVAIVGDSILGGGTVLSGLEGGSITRYIAPELTDNPGLYNLGLSSQTLAQIASSAASREDTIAADAVYAGGERVLVIQGGTNDFSSGASVAAGFGATLYGTLSSYITARRAAGFTKIVACTVLPCSNSTDWQNPASQAWTERNAYNALIRANSAGADVVLDLASHPVMGVYANTASATYYQDRLHPTREGLRLLSLTGDPVGGRPVTYRDAINAVL